MPQHPKLVPFLWFKDNAEEALRFYLTVFEGSRLLHEQRWGDGGMAPKGTLMTATFTIGDQQVAVLNGNRDVRFSDSMSLLVHCDTQAEVDRLWTKLTADGGEPGQCGWLVDKFGVSWQIVPVKLRELFGSKDPAKAQRVGAAMMGMSKLDLAVLQKAHDSK